MKKRHNSESYIFGVMPVFNLEFLSKLVALNTACSALALENCLIICSVRVGAINIKQYYP
jgi:hypothetical protein